MTVELSQREIVVYFWVADGPKRGGYCFDCRIRMNLPVERGMEVRLLSEVIQELTTNDMCSGCHRTWAQVLAHASAVASVAHEETLQVATH